MNTNGRHEQARLVYISTTIYRTRGGKLADLAR
jgi:hypothetical protein